MSLTVSVANKDIIEVLLVVTEECNLNCIYCYEHNKSPKKMSFDVAKRIIDSEFYEAKQNGQRVVIQFFGGEPFLEFDTIKKIYEYICDSGYDNFEHCFVVTNGTLLKKTDKEWLQKNKETIICGLSMDGTKEVHDYNRSNSYDLIDFDFFRKTWPKQKIKMTVSPEMLPKLAECTVHCHNLGFGVLNNLADGIAWDSGSSDTLKQQLSYLIDYYISHPNIDICTMLKMPLLHVDLANRQCFPKWCGAGSHIHAYDTIGKKYPCQLFMSLTEKGIPNIELMEQYPLGMLEDRCQKCILFGCCPTCLGSNILRNKSLFYHTDVECMNIKIQFKATSYLMYERFKRNQVDMPANQKTLLLKSIEKIQTAFCDI